MAIEDVHLDVLQNIEFAIVSVYRKQRNLRDLDVIRALDALIDVYRAEARGHTPKDISLPEPEGTVFQRVKEMCDFRLGRQVAADPFSAARTRDVPTRRASKDKTWETIHGHRRRH